MLEIVLRALVAFKTLVTLLADVNGLEFEELKLNVVSAISNLSYYAIPGSLDGCENKKINARCHFMETEGEKVIGLMTPMLLENEQEGYIGGCPRLPIFPGVLT